MVYPRIQTCWIIISVLVFTVSWTYTYGGYLCSIPIALLLLAYVATHQSNKPIAKESLMSTLKTHCKEKAVELFQTDWRSLVLLVSYWMFVVTLLIWYPRLEESNGSPYSLIFFTITFIFLYIVPTLVWLFMLPLSVLLQWETGVFHGEKSKTDIRAVLCIIWRQRLTIGAISLIVLFMFVVDADLTCVIRYTMKGKPCWPVLIPNSLRSHLPYPLQHAWIQSWHRVFSGYTPGTVQMFIQNFGRELGEVPKLLPVLIGVYVVSLLIVPSKHTTLRLTVFSCMAGVVLGGISSGSLKILLHRYRPNAYGNPYRWTGPGTTVVNHLAFSKLDLSFPAGHTSVTSAVATCLYVGLLHSNKVCSVTWKIMIAFLLYLFPVAVLVSRVGDCYHWNSDATFGVCCIHQYDHAVSPNLSIIYTNNLFTIPLPFPLIHIDVDRMYRGAGDN